MNKNKLLLELIWWAATFLVAALILYPIWSKVSIFPENINVYNLLNIIITITLTRYIFLLEYTFLAQLQKVKAFMIILCVPLIIFCINSIFTFRAMIDNDGYDVICQGVVVEKVNSLGLYYKNEYIFFGVAALISSVVFGVRMVVSIWRKINRGTV
jgi:hypothetical protein